MSVVSDGSDVSEIDQQHQVLVNMLNRLNDAVKNKESREVIYRIIDDVIEFTRLHFAAEEKLMINSGYADVDFHKDKHRQLMEDALHLKGKLANLGGRNVHGLVQSLAVHQGSRAYSICGQAV